MKKQQFKQVAMLGLAAAALTVSGTAEGSILEEPGILLAACGGAGNCGAKGRGNVAYEDVRVNNGATGATGATGHSCSGATSATRSGHSCSNQGNSSYAPRTSGSCNGQSNSGTTYAPRTSGHGCGGV